MNKKHIFIYSLLRPLVNVFLFLKFHYKYKKAENLPDTYIVLSNHVTDYDPLLVAVSFPRQMYFVASEHIARWGILSKIINFLVAPIVRYKGTVAAQTVMDALRKIKAGANVCIFAEGVRTWDGVTCPILPSTGKMVKSARCGLVTFKISGGYFVSPGWCDHGTRKGPLSGTPVNIYTKEQLAAMSVDEINKHICEDLYEDAYAKQLESPQRYTGKDLAEGLENLFFICPKCGSIDTITTKGDDVHCSSCKLTFSYNEYGLFENAPFKTVKEYANWQKNRVNEDASKGISYSSKNGILKKIVKHEETVMDQGGVTLTGQNISCGTTSFSLESISNIAFHGRHSLVFSIGKEYYELRPSDTDNVIKFLWLFESYRELANK